MYPDSDPDSPAPPTDDGDHPDHDVGEEADPDHRAEEGQHEPVHRRKINAEEKPKFVAAVWGDRIDYFLAAIAVLYQDRKKDDIKSS